MENCTPSNVIPSKDEVRVEMQNVVDHHTTHILDPEVRERMRDMIEEDPRVKFRMIWKYGFDGSSSQSHYQYEPVEDEDEDDEMVDQSSLLMTHIVPVQLVAEASVLERIGVFPRKVIWTNRMCNSPFGVSPLRYKFEKENSGMKIILVFFIFLKAVWTAFHESFKNPILICRSNTPRA